MHETCLFPIFCEFNYLILIMGKCNVAKDSDIQYDDYKEDDESYKTHGSCISAGALEDAVYQ